MTDGKDYNNILLGGRGGTKSGQLRVNPGGIAWKKQGGGKLIEFHKSDIVGLTWMEIPRTYQLGVRSRDGAFYKFTGFHDQDVSNLTTYMQTNIGLTPVEKQFSVSGKNWGDGSFHSCQDGYAVKSSLKAEEGVLYPLEKCFFFLPKPPTLILHDEIECVEFDMHADAGTSMQYFDLLVKLKNEQEHLFCNIQRNEYHNLSEYITGKGLKIMNQGNSRTMEDAERFKNEIDESDEETDDDFKMDRESDGSSPTDDSGGEESDASLSGDVNEKPAKKDTGKEALALKPASANKRKSTKDGDEDGGKKKKAKKKKHPNPPNKAMSSFMFFCSVERENIKKINPGISFTDTARALGEKWNSMTVEEKEPYEAKAAADRKRYQDAMARYKGDVPPAIIASDSE